MPTEIYLIKVGMNMTEGVVEEWCIADGADVAAGELLYRLETEKVNLDVDADVGGTVRHLVGEGISKEPGDVIGYIYAAGEAIPDVLPGADGGPPAAASAPADEPAAEADVVAINRAAPARSGDGRIKSSPAARRLAGELGVDIESLAGSGPGGRIVEADVQAAADSGGADMAATGGAQRPSSPIARKLAREVGIDLSRVNGTGPGGRITKEDVEAAAATRAGAPMTAETLRSGAPAVASTRPSSAVPIRGMRKTIAARMHESLQTMAQLTMDMDVVMDDAIKLRKQLIEEWQDEGIRPSYNDLVIRAVAKALLEHPLMNASFGEREIELHGHANVGMAVALDEGLIVPVVQQADGRSLKDIAQESARLAVAARDNTLALDDLQHGTFTVSALGMFGVDAFTPIINSPQAGILGVNRIRDDVTWDGDRPVRQQVMRLSLTWDHRVLDGAPAAQFLATVKALLEAPFRLLV
jgi:pyruvate dehydrogenase E2 component (dihydrolipoamide acetyltransferase)